MLWAALRRCYSSRLRIGADDTRIANFSIFGGGRFGDCWRRAGARLVGGATAAGAAGRKRGDWRIEGRGDRGSRPVGSAVASREIVAGRGDGAGLRDGAGPVVADGFAAAGGGRRAET